MTVRYLRVEPTRDCYPDRYYIYEDEIIENYEKEYGEEPSDIQLDDYIDLCGYEVA